MTLAYIRQEHPGWLGGLRVLQYSAQTPGLPFISSRTLPQDWLISLRNILLEPDEDMATLMRRLHISGFTYRGEEDYTRILHLESEARNFGYIALA